MRRLAHLPECGELRPIGRIAAEVVADLRFRRQVIRLHRQGPRVLGEYLAELGVERDIGTIIDQKLDAYAELGPEALEAAGGDRFWPLPLYKTQLTTERPDRPATAHSSATQPHEWKGNHHYAAKSSQ